MLLQNKISDQKIINLIEENNHLVWGILYDKYSAVIYGLICKLTNDKSLAEEIFLSAFVQIKEKQILSNIKYGLCPRILRYIYNYTIQQLNHIGIIPRTVNPFAKLKLTHILCTESNSLNEVAAIMNMTHEETRRNLRTEILNIRNQTNATLGSFPNSK